MEYSNLRFVNELGGIAADVATGHTAYLAPGSDLHDAALEGWFGPIADFTPPPEPSADDILAAERAAMSVFRLAWEDAAALVTYGPGTLLDAIDAVLAAVPAALARRYGNVTIFERLRPEVSGFLENPDAINLPPTAVDALFRLAMAIEAQASEETLAQRVLEWEAALL